MSRGSAIVLVAAVLVAAAAVVSAEDDYSKVLGMSYEFYQGQMSGNLPAWNALLYSKGGWKKSAHLTDGSSIGADLVGGFYDAGDYLKCPHALAWGTTNLIFSVLEFGSTYKAAGQYDIAMGTIKWALDWLVKAHVKAGDSPAANAFVGQVSGKNDHQYFGRPEHATNERPVYLADSSSPGADLAGEYAAAYAAGAVLFKSTNPAYAATLYSHAKQAFAFAETYKSNWKTPGGVFQAYGSYWPEGYIAHLAWAATWMCKYDSAACPSAVTWFNNAMNTNSLRYGLGYDWDSTFPGVAALVISMGLQPLVDPARQYLEGYILSKWTDTSSKCPKPSYSTVCYTQKGLAYYSDWGTLRNTGNMMFMAALMGKHGANKASALCFARNQMRYILGSDTGKSYLIGFGTNQPQRPHHKQSACNARYNEPCSPSGGGTCCVGESGVGAGGCCTESNFVDAHPALITLSGGLVGGPDQTDFYPDIRNDYQRSEVAFDYNAGFTGAAAGLAAAALGGFNFGQCGGSGAPAPPPSTPNPPAPTPPTTPTPPPPTTPTPPPTTPPPSTPNPPPSPPPSGSCKLSPWSQCGGMSGCPAGQCVDKAWAGQCCSSGACKRQNEWYWQCVPSLKSLRSVDSQSPINPAGGQADMLRSFRTAAVDDLQVSAPATAPAGAPVTLTATLTRFGAPVPGIVVQFAIDGAATMAGGGDASVADVASPVLFVSAQTGLDGTATVVVPSSAVAVGTSSVVTATVQEARAMGAKGNIAVQSPDVTVTWV